MAGGRVREQQGYSAGHFCPSLQVGVDESALTSAINAAKPTTSEENHRAITVELTPPQKRERLKNEWRTKGSEGLIKRRGWVCVEENPRMFPLSEEPSECCEGRSWRPPTEGRIRRWRWPLSNMRNEGVVRVGAGNKKLYWGAGQDTKITSGA